MSANRWSWMVVLAILSGAGLTEAEARAGDEAEEAKPERTFSEEELAEYRRLSDRLQRLGEKTTWGGVERVFLQMEEAGYPLSQRDYLLGAEAARDRGDMKNVRDRLLMAMRAQPDLSTGRSLAEIQGNYGAVILTAKTKNSDDVLQPEVRPFQPDRAKAIDYASEMLENEGVFDGLIPVGNYTFGEKSFEIQAGVEPVEIDLKNK